MRPHFALTLFAPLLLLAGCRDQAATAPADAAATVTPAATSGTRPDYWPMLAPLVAGAYGGDCTRPPNPAKFEGSIVIAADGKLTAGDITQDLRAADLSLVNTVDKGNTTTGLMAQQGQFSLMVADKGAERGTSATATSGEQSVSCDKDMKAPAIRGVKLYPLLAKLLDSPGRKLTCAPGGRIADEQVEYKVAGGVLTLHDETFDLNAVEKETATFSDRLGKVSYSSRWADGRNIKIDIDESGKPAGLQGRGKDGQLYACSQVTSQ